MYPSDIIKYTNKLLNIHKSSIPDTIPEPSNNEYISLCNYTIVYRNNSGKYLFNWIKNIQHKYSDRCRLLLVRQIDNHLQLLWTGSIPEEFWFNRRRETKIVIDKKEFIVISSISISQEEFF